MLMLMPGAFKNLWDGKPRRAWDDVPQVGEDAGHVVDFDLRTSPSAWSEMKMLMLVALPARLPDAPMLVLPMA